MADRRSSLPSARSFAGFITDPPSQGQSDRMTVIITRAFRLRPVVANNAVTKARTPTLLRSHSPTALPGGPVNCPSCGNALAPGVPACPTCGLRLSVPQPDPPLLPPLRPIRGLTIAVITLLGIWIVVELFVAAVDLVRISLLDRVLADPASVGLSALTVNDALYAAGGVIGSVVYLATAIVFIVWLFRARDNAERANFTRHRRSKPWLILGWGVPIVSLWFPKQIIDDIWRASEPATPPGGAKLDIHPKPALVYPWWACWLIFAWVSELVMKLLYGRAGFEGLGELEGMKWSATAELGAAPIGIAAAVLAALIVRKISAFQETRRSREMYSSPFAPSAP